MTTISSRDRYLVALVCGLLSRQHHPEGIDPADLCRPPSHTPPDRLGCLSRGNLRLGWITTRMVQVGIPPVIGVGNERSVGLLCSHHGSYQLRGAEHIYLDLLEHLPRSNAYRYHPTWRVKESVKDVIIWTNRARTITW